MYEVEGVGSYGDRLTAIRVARRVGGAYSGLPVYLVADGKRERIFYIGARI